MAKKLFRITLHADPSATHDLMSMSGIDIQDVQPIKHGGEDAHGNLRDAPTGREFLLAFGASRKSFTVREAAAEGARLGLVRSTITSTIGAMKREKLLKHLDTGTYALVTKNVERIVPKKKVGRPGNPKQANGHLITGAGADLVLKLVAKGDIKTAKVKEAFAEASMSPKTVNNLLHKMKRAGQIKSAGLGLIAKGA